MSPFHELRQLQHIIEKLADDLDLDLLQFAALPEEVDAIHLVFGIRAKAVKTQDEIESDEISSEFDLILGQLTVSEEGEILDAELPVPEKTEAQKRYEDKVEQAKARLKGWSGET